MDLCVGMRDFIVIYSLDPATNRITLSSTIKMSVCQQNFGSRTNSLPSPIHEKFVRVTVRIDLNSIFVGV